MVHLRHLKSLFVATQCESFGLVMKLLIKLTLNIKFGRVIIKYMRLPIACLNFVTFVASLLSSFDSMVLGMIGFLIGLLSIMLNLAKPSRAYLL